MTSFIQNMLWNSVSGFVEAGTKTVGGYAGDALIKAGDMVEGGGRSVGNGIERKATGLGSSITGQTYKPSAKALPSTARRPAAHRSNSLPANTKPSTGGSGTPLGAKKYPSGAAGAAKKSVGGVAKGAGGAVGGVTKGAGGAVGNLSKTAGSTVGGAKSTIGGVTSGVARGAGGLSKPLGGVPGLPKTGPAANSSKAPANSAAKRTNSLPKPYTPGGGAQNGGLPKPYGNTNAYPGSEKKTAVRPGQSKPFVPPQQEKKEEKKPYPGTNTLPGQGGRTPVSKYKPMQRYEPPAKKGEVKHLAF